MEKEISSRDPMEDGIPIRNEDDGLSGVREPLLPVPAQPETGIRHNAITPERPPAAYGLGLCSYDVLSPSEIAELEEDMDRLRNIRIQAKANARNIWLS